MNLWKEFTKGLVAENPIFRLALSDHRKSQKNS